MRAVVSALLLAGLALFSGAGSAYAYQDGYLAPHNHGSTASGGQNLAGMICSSCTLYNTTNASGFGFDLSTRSYQTTGASFTPPALARQCSARACACGGGGGSGLNITGAAAQAGGNLTIGNFVLTGGAAGLDYNGTVRGGAIGAVGTVGGTGVFPSSSIFRSPGNPGTGGAAVGSGGDGSGGGSAYFGGGAPSCDGAACVGVNAVAESGGGGGAGASSGTGGGGGAGGECADIRINRPAAGWSAITTTFCTGGAGGVVASANGGTGATGHIEWECTY